MREANTFFATIDTYEKGGVEITGDDTAEHYLFSNMYEIAKHSKPWERVVLGTNLEYVIECVRAEGASPWYLCAHDENALIVQGAMETHFVKPQDASLVPSPETNGAIALGNEVEGANMGYVKATLGHMTLLPAGAAYQFRPSELTVLLLQTAKGAVSVEKWADICQRTA